MAGAAATTPASSDRITPAFRTIFITGHNSTPITYNGPLWYPNYGNNPPLSRLVAAREVRSRVRFATPPDSPAPALTVQLPFISLSWFVQTDKLQSQQYSMIRMMPACQLPYQL